MALATVDEVLEEGGVGYTDFKFADDAAFRGWIDRRITWIDGKIKLLVGPTNYSAAYPDIKYAEIFWVISTMLSRKQIALISSIEGGFAIGSLRIDNATPAAVGLTQLAQGFFKRAMTMLTPYAVLTRADFLIALDKDEDYEFIAPADRFWLRMLT